MHAMRFLDTNYGDYNAGNIKAFIIISQVHVVDERGGTELAGEVRVPRREIRPSGGAETGCRGRVRRAGGG